VKVGCKFHCKFQLETLYLSDRANYQLSGRPWRISERCTVFDGRRAAQIGVPAGDPEGHGRQDKLIVET
jgi:hypothetical protein